MKREMTSGEFEKLYKVRKLLEEEGSGMAKDDLPVVLYKLLAYIYACMKGEVEATVEQARKLCEANETIFDTAVHEAISNGYVLGVEREFFYSGPDITFNDARLTLKGSDFLLENSMMHKAKKIAGETFTILLGQIVASAAKLNGL